MSLAPTYEFQPDLLWAAVADHHINGVLRLRAGLHDGDLHAFALRQRLGDIRRLRHHHHAATTRLRHLAQLASGLVHGDGIVRKLEPLKLAAVIVGGGLGHYLSPSTILAMVFNCMLEVPS